MKVIRLRGGKCREAEREKPYKNKSSANSNNGIIKNHKIFNEMHEIDKKEIKENDLLSAIFGI